MKKTTATALVAAASLAATLALAAPASATPASTAPAGTTPASTAPRPSDQVVPAGAPVSKQSRAKLDALVARLPADWESSRDRLLARTGVEPSPMREVLDARVAEAIDPDDYVCGPTRFDAFAQEAIEQVDPGTLSALSTLGVLDFPLTDALLFGTEGDPDYDLRRDADVLDSSFEYSQRFWDVKLDDVQLMGMHGDLLTDVDRLTPLAELFYELEPAEAADVARDIVDLVRSDPALKRGQNPIFTLNALAFSGDVQTDPLLSELPEKVIFGDGLLAALKAMGLKKIGAQAIMAHEVSHHVQWEADVYDSDLPMPEASRRTELMADAFASYMATHKKGLGLTANQLLLTQDSFADLGDCQYENPQHHGTPSQRRAAASWGIATAATGDAAVRVISAARLGARFDRVLPRFVAPDAPTSPAAWRAAVEAAA